MMQPEYQETLTTVMQYLRPAMEVTILAFLIYKVLYFMRGTRGAYVLSGLITALLALMIAASSLHLEVIGWLVGSFWSILATAIIVIFQPELRRAFAQLGTYTVLRGKRQREVIGEIVTAVVDMARRKCGALIVVERRIGMRALEEDSVKIDIKVSAIILETIFFPNSPLHDGAVIIRDNRIVAARVILPLTRSGEDVSRRLGTRHRAALGISEETDGIAIVVSEETGSISVCCRGALRRNLAPEGLEDYLEQLIITEQDDVSPGISDFLDESTANDMLGGKTVSEMMSRTDESTEDRK